MVDAPYVGELRLFSGQVPDGWAPCDGTLLSIAANQALFALIGTIYGGDGRINFALPDLRERVAIGYGSAADLSAYPIGASGGQAAVALTRDQMPAHGHQAFCATGPGGADSPGNGVWAVNMNEAAYAQTATGTMAPLALTLVGDNQPHPNVQPTLAVNWAICLQGVFPNFE
ncbi:phage tail protein [Sphingomonas changnyeongensis]|uniref:Phage tail protein n=1 Tax=Sphingomonas changnyeongensis TaxID=2698679 RepID=A0A7Z2S416_9SPHN|nr:tail fiber protein [Sphingomonas changnyeongensis]QHL89565.1 phage tail protein [Sphingomonas changnyeongensis]